MLQVLLLFLSKPLDKGLDEFVFSRKVRRLGRLECVRVKKFEMEENMELVPLVNCGDKVI